MTVRESVWPPPVADRDVTFDAADIGVMSLMIDMGQAQEIDRHPMFAVSVLPRCRGFLLVAALSSFPMSGTLASLDQVSRSRLSTVVSPRHPALSFVSSECCTLERHDWILWRW